MRDDAFRSQTDGGWQDFHGDKHSRDARDGTLNGFDSQAVLFGGLTFLSVLLGVSFAILLRRGAVKPSGLVDCDESKIHPGAPQIERLIAAVKPLDRDRCAADI